MNSGDEPVHRPWHDSVDIPRRTMGYPPTDGAVV